MKHILIPHDGKSLNISAKDLLKQIMQNIETIHLLYVVPQNLVHYGQVDQLASPICKSEYIEYVHELGIKECREQLQPLIFELTNMASGLEHNVEIKLHVRWGDVSKAILELVADTKVQGVYIQQKTFNEDWLKPSNPLNLKLAEILRVL